MHGTNPIRKPVMDDGHILQVVEIFPTLQGEGPRAGEPAIFIRLGGCNLACDFCDTEFERFAPMATEDVVAQIENSSLRRGEAGRGALREKSSQLSPLPSPPPNGEGISLVIITGGEPLRQNIVPLCEALISAGFTVQIETNGTLWRELPEEVEVVCSPKNTGQGYMPIRADLLRRTRALKYIVSATHPLYRDLPDLSALNGHAPEIFVQPMDEEDPVKNEANRKHAIDIAIRRGYRVSLQLHKILGID